MEDDEYFDELEATSQKKKSSRKSYKSENISKKKLRNSDDTDIGFIAKESIPSSKYISPTLLMQTPTSMSIVVPKSSVDKNLPQPSPAACGKRKEVQAPTMFTIS